MTQSDHIPVLLDAVLESLTKAPEGLIIDATFGAGGYSEAVLRTTDRMVVAIDRDPDTQYHADRLAAHYGDRFCFRPGRFADIASLVTDIPMPIAAIMMDLGVSSMQLDQGERGFSFQGEYPLDMRMGHEGVSAAQLIAQASEAQLADILYYFGEERAARRVARVIVQKRKAASIVTTAQLANVVRGAVPGQGGKIDKATRTFQAVRIAINGELDELCACLCAASQLLTAGGILACVAFHSLEDRIVKHFLRYADAHRQSATSARGQSVPQDFVLGAGALRVSFLPLSDDYGTKFANISPMEMLTKRPIVASLSERAHNVRARSAKLRVARRYGENR
ncbi:MAG: 16S rRNA (cytosine(1402)-N(4))-methyltransferase RsmH [Pseudomonadota bacterium]